MYIRQANLDLKIFFINLDSDNNQKTVLLESTKFVLTAPD